MYFQLTEALKRRFILELRRFWATHPKYRDIVDHIQGKYSFEERPQYGIIVKTGGGNQVKLSADNYMGIDESYVFLTKVKGYPGFSVEWVIEDALAIQGNGGAFPSPPGVYFVDMETDERFWVHPLLDVSHERVVPVGLECVLAKPFLAGTLRLYEMPSGFRLIEGVNYDAVYGPDKHGVGITLRHPLTGGRTLSADYRTPAATHGPYTIAPQTGHNGAIPGVVLAFGTRCEAGDQVAVVVQDARHPASLAYGGRWDLQMDFDVLARDPQSQQIISDMSVMYLNGILNSYLADEGIEITEISMGGESEEVFDENGDDFYYNASFSATVQTDWRINVPLGPFMRQVAPMSAKQAADLAALPDDRVGQQQDNIRDLSTLGLEAVIDPFFKGRVSTFEAIK